MKHLSPSELVEFAEGTLASRRAQHVDACETCRASAADLLDAMRRASVDAAEVPEPSPLFWGHLSARVRDGIARERVGGAPWWLASLRPYVPAAAALVVVVLVSATMVNRRPVPSEAVEITREAAHVEPGMDVDATIDPANREVWEVLTAAAADLELEDAHAVGLSVQPSTVDRAVQRLTPDELNELGRLLQSELKRSND